MLEKNRRMPLPRLYLAPDMLPPDMAQRQISLTPMHSHYLRHVLRMKDGMSLLLFNAAIGEWRAELVPSGRGQEAQVRLSEQTRPPLTAQAQGPDIWLLCSPLKRTRLALALEKATELGVRAVHLARCAFTQAPPPALPRLQRVMIEAAEQCGRLDVPLLHPPRPLQELLSAWSPRRLVLLCDERAVQQDAAGPEWLDAQTLSRLPAHPWAVLVGPEGGFSDTERRFLLRLPYVRRIGLGAQILRAETAVAGALAILQFCRRASDYARPRSA